jgi:hypothetical protein
VTAGARFVTPQPTRGGVISISQLRRSPAPPPLCIKPRPGCWDEEIANVGCGGDTVMEFLDEQPVRRHELGVAGPQFQRPRDAHTSADAVKLFGGL